MKTPRSNASQRKARHNPGPGVLVVENFQKAKLSPSLQAQVDKANELMERVKLPEGWEYAEKKEEQAED